MVNLQNNISKVGAHKSLVASIFSFSLSATCSRPPAGLSFLCLHCVRRSCKSHHVRTMSSGMKRGIADRISTRIQMACFYLYVLAWANKASATLEVDSEILSGGGTERAVP